MDSTRTIPDVLNSGAERFGPRVAFQRRSAPGAYERHTYLQVRERARAIAEGLRHLGVRKGDRVAIFDDNSPAWSLAALGSLSGGLVLVPVHAQAKPPEAQQVLEHAAARVLFTSADRAASLPAIEGLERIVLLDADEGRPGPSGGGRPRSGAPGTGRSGPLAGLDAIPLSALAAGKAPPGGHPVAPDDWAMIAYTSGTSGRPKGVVLSHRNIVANLRGLLGCFSCGPEDRVLSILPLSHILEFVAGFLAPLASGATITYCRKVTSEEILATMQDTGTTIIIGVPQVYRFLLNEVRRRIGRLPGFLRRALEAPEPPRWLRHMLRAQVRRALGGHIRYCFVGGAPVAAEVLEGFAGLGIPLLQGYGLTEASPIIAVNRVDDNRLGSVGRPLPGLEVRLVDRDADGQGEVAVRGESVMVSYYRDEEETRRTMRDGWLHTGDIGWLDPEGYLYIRGRTKRVILTEAGKNIYPEELEEILAQSPLIREVAVFGVEERGRGEKAAALIYPAGPPMERQEHTRAAIVAEVQHLTAGLSDHKRIALVEVSPVELPKTATRKVKLHEAKVLFEEIRRRTPAPGQKTPVPEGDAVGRAVAEALAAVLEIPPGEVFLEARLDADLGLDSLGRLEVWLAIEKQLGAPIPETEFATLDTVQGLIDYVRSRDGTGSATAHARQVGPVPRIRLRRTARDIAAKASPAARLVRGTFNRLLRLFLRLYHRLEVAGTEQVDFGRPLILAPNHASHLDILSLLAAVPPAAIHRTFPFAAQDYFFTSRFRGFLVRLLLNAVPFDRKGNPRRGMDLARTLLMASGGCLIIFPEGTRSPDGTVQAFRPGVIQIGHETGAPIHPVLIGGTYDAMPKGALLPRPRKIRVRFGPPFEVQLGQGEARARLEALTREAARLREMVLALRGD